ncbi:MAG: hypothetical protein AMXMBFR84_04880 [Candidatus Hydrogenedentota bacterium]
MFVSSVEFIRQNMPSTGMLAVGGPAFLAYSVTCLAFAGWLKRRYNWPTGYTRKIFHLLIFGMAAALHFAAGTRWVCLFGAIASMVIFFAVWQGEGHLLYEAMAREKDAPRRTRYIMIPYIATLLGGVLSNVWFGPCAIAGYLVTGVADAIAEPVGTRFGRHPYRTLSASGVRADRTLEGSGAVLVASAAMLLLATQSAGLHVDVSMLYWGVPVGAVVCTGVEALSPHGWDNLTLQIVPSAFLFGLVHWA